jgi:ribose-phosphate pyrophosphokinase
VKPARNEKRWLARRTSPDAGWKVLLQRLETSGTFEGSAESRGLGQGPAAARMTGRLAIVAGSSNPALATAIARELGVPLAPCAVERFPDGELSVRLLEPVRCREVFLVQPTSPPVNDHLVELLALADACRRGAAARITAIVPYFGYGRGDKRHGHLEPIMGRVVADLLETAGVGQVVTVDLHTPQIEGFFHAAVNTLTAAPTLCRALQARLPPDLVVVSPDVGRAPLAAHYSQCLGAPLIVLHKRRASGTETVVTHVVGDVSGRACLIVDDMISTGGTVVGSVAALLAAGARPEITVAATHGLLLPGACRKLEQALVREVYVTDTVPVADQDCPLLHVVSIAPLLAGVVMRCVTDGWEGAENP